MKNQPVLANGFKSVAERGDLNPDFSGNSTLTTFLRHDKAILAEMTPILKPCIISTILLFL